MSRLRLWLTVLVLAVGVLAMTASPVSAHWSTYTGHSNTYSVRITGMGNTWHTGSQNGLCYYVKRNPWPDNNWFIWCEHFHRYEHRYHPGECWVATRVWDGAYIGILHGSPPSCWGD